MESRNKVVPFPTFAVTQHARPSRLPVAQVLPVPMALITVP